MGYTILRSAPWLRAPTLLWRTPAVFGACLLAVTVLATAAASGTLFLSSAGIGALHSEAAQGCPQDAEPAIATAQDGPAPGGGYATTQAISALVHGHTDLDGIQYRSRLDSDHLCLALFERADAAFELVAEGEPIARDWAEALLTPRGRRIVDL